MFRTVSCVAVALLISFTRSEISAQTPSLGPIYPAPCDIPDMSMVGYGNCMDLEYAVADSALNAAYKLVQQRLGPTRFGSVRDDQRIWLSRRSGIKPEPNAGNHPSMTVLPSLITMTRGRTFELQHVARVADEDQASPLPIQSTFRLASGNRGLVLQLRNQLSSPIQVVARFFDPWSNQLRQQLIALTPNVVVEIGWAEGWRFETGHMVELLHGSFASRFAVAP